MVDGRQYFWRFTSGAWQGSISGGCVEEFLLERAFPPSFSPTTTPFIPEIHHFGINSEQAARFCMDRFIGLQIRQFDKLY